MITWTVSYAWSPGAGHQITVGYNRFVYALVEAFNSFRAAGIAGRGAKRQFSWAGMGYQEEILVKNSINRCLTVRDVYP